MTKRTFRYAACGGFNAALNILIYWYSFHFVLHDKGVQTPLLEISAHIAAFLIAFAISFPLGFVLMRYIVFPESEIRGRTQLFRYLLMVGFCLLLNYIFLKFFVEYCHFFPTVSIIITTFLVAAFSYFAQQHFTFKVKKAQE